MIQDLSFGDELKKKVKNSHGMGVKYTITPGINGARGFLFRKEKTMSEVDSNKMHLESLQQLIQTIDSDEAVSISKILVRRFPEIVLTVTSDYVCDLRSSINAVRAAANGEV